jgi:hypothetical protein
MHEAPDRTRRLYEEMHNAPPLKGKAPWLEAMHDELKRVLGEDAMSLCRKLEKKRVEDPPSRGSGRGVQRPLTP